MKTLITIFITLFLISSCVPQPPQVYNPQPAYANIIFDIERDLCTATTPEEIARLETTLIEVKLRQAEAIERQGVRQNIQDCQPTVIDQLLGVATTTAIIGGITKAIWN